MVAGLYTMDKYLDHELVPDPTIYLFSETLLRYEVVTAMPGTRFTKTRIIACLQYVCSVTPHISTTGARRIVV